MAVLRDATPGQFGTGRTAGFRSAVHDGGRAAAGAVAGDGQRAAGRAGRDDFGAEEIGKEIQGDVSQVLAHVWVVPWRPG